MKSFRRQSPVEIVDFDLEKLNLGGHGLQVMEWGDRSARGQAMVVRVEQMAELSSMSDHNDMLREGNRAHGHGSFFSSFLTRI